LPGEEGGHAIADVLFGKVSPAGRLPMTLPRHSGQLPLYYNHKPSGARSQFWGDYSDMPSSPLFAFGHGLSYSRFEYGALQLSSLTPDAADTLHISLDVKNVGERAADEVVQLYVRDVVGSVTRPVQELKGFIRLSLAVGQISRVTFALDLRQLAFYDGAMLFGIEPGALELMVGASSADIRQRITLETGGAKRGVARAQILPTVVTVE
jgi:beta-glucosidase